MCGAADRRNSGHDKQRNDRNVLEIGREKRTDTQCKTSEMVVPSSAAVTSLPSLLLDSTHLMFIPHELLRYRKTLTF
jgi:hypothetical protein